VAIAAGTIVVVAFMVVADTGPDVVLVSALCILVGVGLWSFSELMDGAVESTDLMAGPTSTMTQSTDRRVMRLRSGLVYGRHDDDALEPLRASLVELIDDQLRAAHQIDRAEDPDSARAVLGAELSAFVDDPGAAHALARPNQLDRILTLIERI
jgi:hypothetical protein